MSHLRFIVIGITDAPRPWFPPEVMEVIKEGKVFSGGKRHHEIVASLLPEGAEWIDITVPLERVFEMYRRPTPPVGHPSREGGEAGAEIVVFASGDPLFFGFANTLKREFPEAELKVFPTFNSLQMLAHRLVMPYHDMRIVSLTGRPWQEFDRALIERAPKIGVLTDKEHTPAAIAQRMLEYGYTYYNMCVGEHLGNPEKERVTTLTLEEAAGKEFGMPNCVILDGQTVERTGIFGIPDSSFALLDGREKMITKMPIRLLTLQALELPTKKVLWDIGACTGSVSIEARLLFPHLHIEAFEIRQECEAIIKENARRFGAMGINVHIGDFEDSLPALPIREEVVTFDNDKADACSEQITPSLIGRAGGESPDAVFIGGHGGKLKEMMAKVVRVMAPGGVIVMNSVNTPVVEKMTNHRPSSQQLWDEACRELGLRQEPPMRVVIDDHHPIVILKAHLA